MNEDQTSSNNPEIEQVSVKEMFLLFFRIGMFTIGGGYAMLPLIEKKLVEERKWVDSSNFLDNLSVSQSIPGPIIVNFSFLTGYRLRGYRGGFVSLIGAVLPSFIVILSIALFLWQYHEMPTVQSAFKGMRPVVVALIAFAALRLGKKVFNDYTSVALFVIFLALLILLSLHPLVLILGAALIGMLLYRLKYTINA